MADSWFKVEIDRVVTDVECIQSVTMVVRVSDPAYAAQRALWMLSNSLRNHDAYAVFNVRTVTDERGRLVAEYAD